MTAIARSVLSLRIFGDEVRPSEITALLGTIPDRAHAKGEVMPKSGHSWTSGHWSLQATPSDAGDIDSQVRELLARVTNDLNVWQQLSRHKVDMFCGAFMENGNEGFILSCETMSALAKRSIKIGFDIYAPD